MENPFQRNRLSLSSVAASKFLTVVNRPTS